MRCPAEVLDNAILGGTAMAYEPRLNGTVSLVFMLNTFALDVVSLLYVCMLDLLI